MAEAVVNTSVDRCAVGIPIVCANADIVAKGEVRTIGTVAAAAVCNVAIAANYANGATQRAVDVALGLPPKPDRWTPIFVCENVKAAKKAADDAIAAGSPLWFSVNDNAFVSALNKVASAGVCLPCATAIELSNDPADTILVAFNGYKSTGVAGTGA